MPTMAADVTSITPGRGRAGDSFTIAGSGFSAAAGRNGVTVDGIAATVTSESDTAIAVTVPAGIAEDVHVDVVVSNLTDATSSTWRWWSKASATTLRTLRLALNVGGRGEVGEPGQGKDNDRDDVAQARFLERVITLLEFLPWDLLTAVGATPARGTSGLVRVAPGTTGQRYTRDLTNTAGSWRTRHVVTHAWARQIQTGDTTEQTLNVGGVDTTTTMTHDGNAGVVYAGKLAIITLACRRANPAGSTINRVRIFLNGTAAWDSSDVSVAAVADRPAVAADGTWVAYPWLTVAAGDRLAFAVTKSNGTSEMNLHAFGLVF